VSVSALRKGAGAAHMRYLRIAPGGELPDISHLAPFKAMVSLESAVGAQRRDEICRWLVAMGCRYVIAVGEDSDAWPGLVRAANLARTSVDALDAADFVMVTSHPHESPRAVMSFAKRAARHPEFVLEGLVVIHFAARDRAGEYEVMYRRA